RPTAKKRQKQPTTKSVDTARINADISPFHGSLAPPHVRDRPLGRRNTLPLRGIMRGCSRHSSATRPIALATARRPGNPPLLRRSSDREGTCRSESGSDTETGLPKTGWCCCRPLDPMANGSSLTSSLLMRTQMKALHRLELFKKSTFRMFICETYLLISRQFA